ncbi:MULTISPECIES: TetR/AcrR family transcriptional regulator [unclassified Amycolatopsis]|uniref:TetR/AcrR family transcriptional regulator n=1 Tax=unclassified Amycolatopsis TaxID=2618356 RepID=UPI002E0F6F17|nr:MULTISPECIES: TetR/AcrR family transcriptional regulator [unclassified Amycolatopsis]WSK75216.1 TetR/AcrR family transcriptional regulator [Amycolatopsis sp. NBC_01286]
MDLRTRILEAAADLLSRSAEADFSTRAVCEAAGVGAPALYRQFGDKEGLMAAVVDHGFEKYLAGKRAARPSDDPVRDLRDGWENHVAFAVGNPNYYRLMYSGLSTPPNAAAEAHGLLLEVLERCAAAGRLAVAPAVAAQMVMAANAGVALSMITRPALYPDTGFSVRVRESVLAGILAGEPAEPAGGVAATATTLGAQLRKDAPAALSAAEVTLLQEWLDRLAE